MTAKRNEPGRNDWGKEIAMLGLTGKRNVLHRSDSNR